MPNIVHPSEVQTVLTTFETSPGMCQDLMDALQDASATGREAPAELSRPTAWLFGNEAQGLSEQEKALASHRVAVPLHGAAESLNVGTAATLCLYASARAQRRIDRDGA